MSISCARKWSRTAGREFIRHVDLAGVAAIVRHRLASQSYAEWRDQLEMDVGIVVVVRR